MNHLKLIFLLLSINMMVVVSACVSDDEGSTHTPERPQTQEPSTSETEAQQASNSEDKAKNITPAIPQKPQPRPGIIPTEPIPVAELNQRDGGTSDTLQLEIQNVIFNRIIVKLQKENPMSKEALIQNAEKATGAKIKQALGGPVNTVLLEFEPIVPARDQSAQDRLVNTLKSMEGIVYAEPDRMMQAR